MDQQIPFLDLPRQHAPLAERLTAAFSAAVASAGFVGGKALQEFEAAFATFCGTTDCVGVGNGTDALMLALRCAGVGAGDVVVVPAHTFIATAEAVSMLGATPRLVDCDPQTYTLSAAALAAVDPAGVKAVVPVHLYGQTADMAEISATAKARGWSVIEDCAQAHGARYRGAPAGSLGDLAAFSFYPGKNLGALGDGGAVVGPKGAAMDRLRSVANHGRLTKYEHAEPGVNSRLDTIQATALGIKLPHLNDWNAKRAVVAGWYGQRLAGVAGIVVPQVGAERTHVYHLYVLQVPERDRLGAAFDAARIGFGFHYPLPLHLQPAYRHLGHAAGDFPHSERIANTCFSLPMFPELTESQVDRVCKVVIDHATAGG